MVKYPEGPPPLGKEIYPGEGINTNPFDQNEILDYTTPLGGCTKLYYGISFQLGKWGFMTGKVDESIFVSPINKGYYELVLREKDQLFQQIKSALISISEAYADMELILHDLRKYKQYVEYFEKLRELNKQLAKEKDEDRKKKIESEIRNVEQTLRAIFIDEVDIHTDLPNTPIALRSIVSRWPTIISDFMKLNEEKSPEEIKLDISYAEKIVLATKNKLFLEWKKMFEETVIQRYKMLRELVEARKNSVIEYKNYIRPIIARYKMIRDMLSFSERRVGLLRSFLRPDAQALSLDEMTIWAWKPFAPEEKWKISVEKNRKISLEEVGFTREEIEELIKKKRVAPGEGVAPLPIEPSIDRIVRKIKENIEREYRVALTAEDLFEARNRLLSRYSSEPHVGREGVSWPFSPYFSFAELSMGRTVLVLPDGSQIEDLTIGLRTYLKTQNIIIGHILEMIAREKQFEYEIGSLLGEFGISKEKWESVENMLKEEFGEIYGKYEHEKREEKVEEKKSFFDQVSQLFSKILNFFGLDLKFIRAKGPYEFILYDRLLKYYFKYPKGVFNEIKNYFNLALEVPGSKQVGFI
ncbi:MAG: hypothetical protein QXD89_01620 [Candidatus Aenigmatarchaeota archaeon]